MNTTTTPTAQAYGEPWALIREKKRSSRVIINRNGERVARVQRCSNEKGHARHKQHAHRIKDCVNACQGMSDPAAEIEAMRAAIKNASHFASCILTEAGRQWQATQPMPDIASIEAMAQQIQDELQPFIKP